MGVRIWRLCKGAGEVDHPADSLAKRWHEICHIPKESQTGSREYLKLSVNSPALILSKNPAKYWLKLTKNWLESAKLGWPGFVSQLRC